MSSLCDGPLCSQKLAHQPYFITAIFTCQLEFIPVALLRRTIMNKTEEVNTAVGYVGGGGVCQKRKGLCARGWNHRGDIHARGPAALAYATGKRSAPLNGIWTATQVTQKLGYLLQSAWVQRTSEGTGTGVGTGSGEEEKSTAPVTF